MTEIKSKPKLRPARRVSKDKLKEEKENEASFDASTQDMTVPPAEPSEQGEDTDVIVPACQTDVDSPNIPQGIQKSDEFSDVALGNLSVSEFCTFFETALNTILDNRNIAHEKAEKERIEKAKAAGTIYYTLEELSLKCTDCMEAIAKNYDLYANHKSSIDQHQKKINETQKGLQETCKSLSTIIGRIENAQGVKTPNRPPFPSWACLAFLFWHWPMYAFACAWQSKYFRRFCFLIAFFVMVIEFCLIVLLASDNKSLHHDHAKYVTVRNWSYVMKDTAATNRFDRVDLLFEDVRFNREQIDELNEFIRAKHEQNQKRRK
jgi:hypothetical protein